MKQYTNETQTAKLIELGFEKPKGLADAEPSSGVWVRPAYSIGELIEMLPKEIKCSSLQLYHAGLWTVSYPLYEDKYYVASSELCDALFEMICYLKEKGEI
ncbi:MAG: hypothetical protein IJF01_07330 [Tidjanibacter sp.]|nr:hypothetical protein [Tidjanibacter sp.]